MTGSLSPALSGSSLLSETELGVLVLSLSQDIVYVNARAHRLVEDLRRHTRQNGPSAQTSLPTPLAILCDDLMMQLGPLPSQSHWPSIQVQRCLVGKTASILVRALGLPDVADPLHSKLMVMLESVPSLSVSASRPVSSSRTTLTSREQSVIDGMAAGLTNKQIAERLNLREGTVKEYIKRIRMKVGTTSRRTIRRYVTDLDLERPFDIRTEPIANGQPTVPA